MKLLLDTCALLYSELQPSKLSVRAREALQSGKSEIFVSSISVAEIACGWGKKFELEKHWRPWLREVIKENNWGMLDVDFDIVEESYSLPEPFHRDPADRILVATSRLKQIPLVTNDSLIAAYPYVQIYW